MQVQILVANGGAPLPLGPREMEEAPRQGDILAAEIDGKPRQLEIVVIQHLPVVGQGTFKHDQVWAVCRLL